MAANSAFRPPARPRVGKNAVSNSGSATEKTSGNSATGGGAASRSGAADARGGSAGGWGKSVRQANAGRKTSSKSNSSSRSAGKAASRAAADRLTRISSEAVNHFIAVEAEPEREGPWANPAATETSRAAAIAERARENAEQAARMEAATAVLMPDSDELYPGGTLENAAAHAVPGAKKPGANSNRAATINEATNGARAAAGTINSAQVATNAAGTANPAEIVSLAGTPNATDLAGSSNVASVTNASVVNSATSANIASVAPRPVVITPARTATTTGADSGTDERPTITLSLPNGWARAIASGIEALILAWGLPALCSILGFWLVSTNVWLGDTNWEEALGFGADLWALSLGAPIRVAEIDLSIPPLFWSFLSLITLRGLLARGRHLSQNSQWFAGGAYLVGGLILAYSTCETATWFLTAPGLILTGFGAALWAVLSYSEHYPAWMNKIAWLWRGIRVGAWWFALMLLAGTGIIAGDFFVALPEMKQIGLNLGLTGGSAWLFTALQVCYLPNLAAFAWAWASGAGFYLDEGAVHSTFVAPGAALPQLPLAGLVPASTAGMLPIYIMLAVGLLIGLFLAWKWRNLSYPQMLRLVGVALLVLVVAMALWLRLSSGSLGSGRLVFIGPVTVVGLGRLLLQFALPLFLALALFHPGALRAYQRSCRWSRRQLSQQLQSRADRKAEAVGAAGIAAATGGKAGSGANADNANANNADEVAAAGSGAAEARRKRKRPRFTQIPFPKMPAPDLVDPERETAALAATSEPLFPMEPEPVAGNKDAASSADSADYTGDTASSSNNAEPRENAEDRDSAAETDIDETGDADPGSSDTAADAKGDKS